jgi:hypothetical protein
MRRTEMAAVPAASDGSFFAVAKVTPQCQACTLHPSLSATDRRRHRPFRREIGNDQSRSVYRRVRFGRNTLDSDAGLTKLAPHDLRRIALRLCRAAGGELEQIQFLLGHVSVQTTERYLGCTQRIASAVNDRIGIEPRTSNTAAEELPTDPLRVALTENDPAATRREEDVSIGSGPETQIDSFGSPSRTSSLSLGLSPFAHNFALDRTR